MRLLHTERLDFEEFYDDQIPDYAILSHQWRPVHEEVSYSDFNLQMKNHTSGYAKIKQFCALARQNGFSYCWVDTCCIDKTSSAELSEAINSMFAWYQRATACYVYLRDVHSATGLGSSEWFTRGWTLQELLAPGVVKFFDSAWQEIGTREVLKQEICSASRIDEALLDGRIVLKDYSIAQIMSWAAGRRTSRKEDEAYSLLGLLGVNMPLLYGEKAGAFKRLQEQILANRRDYSLFAWGAEAADHTDRMSILAPSPHAFAGCGNIMPGFGTQRILFEKTGHGLMVLIHRSLNPDVVERLLSLKVDTISSTVGLTIPIGCFERSCKPERPDVEITEVFFLKLALDRGKWRRVGVTRRFDGRAERRRQHRPVYTNDYVRIYLHNTSDGEEANAADEMASAPIRYLHLRDSEAFD